MRRLLFLNLFFSLFICFSCSESIVSSFKKSVNDADKIKIYFYKNGESSERIESIISVDNKDEIKKFIDCITDEDAPFYKCGFTGSAELFKNNESLINMEFNIKSGCCHIIFKFRETMFSKKISDEGINLINQYIAKSK